MNQLTLSFDTPAKLSRKSDPITSQKSAAETEPKLGKLQQAMLLMFQASLWPATANEAAREAVVDFGGCAESYRKRVKELIERDLIEECGERRCEVTGKPCRTFKLKERP